MFSSNYVFHNSCIKKIYPTRVEYIWLSSCREGGFEEHDLDLVTAWIHDLQMNKNSKKFDPNEIQRVCISRIKSKIKDLAECNDFEFFFTQTLKEDRFDLNNFKKIIQKKFKAYKRKNKDFIYLIIYEKHKDGAYHLHGLVGGLGDDVYVNDNGYFSLSFFEDLGFNSLSKIKDKLKVSNYITKYITKDFVKTDSGYSYFHSQKLNVPLVEHVKNIPKNCKLIFENDYLKKWVVDYE